MHRYPFIPFAERRAVGACTVAVVAVPICQTSETPVAQCTRPQMSEMRWLRLYARAGERNLMRWIQSAVQCLVQWCWCPWPVGHKAMYGQVMPGMVMTPPKARLPESQISKRMADQQPATTTDDFQLEGAKPRGRPDHTSFWFSKPWLEKQWIMDSERSMWTDGEWMAAHGHSHGMNGKEERRMQWPFVSFTFSLFTNPPSDHRRLLPFHIRCQSFTQLNQPLAAPHTPPPPLRCRIGRYVAVWDPASCSIVRSGSIQVDGTFQPPAHCCCGV